MAGRILRGAKLRAATAILSVVPGRLYRAVLPLHTPSAPSAGGGAVSGGTAGISPIDNPLFANATDQSGGTASISVTSPPAPVNNWAQNGSVLVAGDAAANDEFGDNVAISRDGLVLAVGATGVDAGATNNGAVYTYDWVGSAWVSRAARIISPSVSSNSQFSPVALNDDGSVLAVGQLSSGSGQVYIYDWGGSAWTLRSTITVSNSDTGLQFGRSVALSGDGSVLFVGADGADSPASNCGAVYVFDWTGSAWAQRGSRITAADAASSDFFGYAVACNSAGTILAISAQQWEGGTSITNAGGVYIYDWNGSAWSQRGAVIEPPSGTDDFFAALPSFNGDGSTLLVGCRPRTGGGGFYMLNWTGSAWDMKTLFVASDTVSGDFFGAVSLSADGQRLVVGARDWEGALTNQGGVYTFDYAAPPYGVGAFTIFPTVAGAGDYTNTTGTSGTGAVTIYPSVAGAGTFPTIYGSGSATIRPAVAGAARIDVAWTAAVSSAPSAGQAALHAYEISWSAAASSAPSEVASEAWAGTLEMPAIGVGYACQGAERSAVSAITITCEIGGIAYPAQYLTIRKRLAAGDGTASYGTETADVAIPYTRVVFSALLAASRAGESIILSARYVLDSGEAYVRPMGDFALTSVKRSANGATVIASGERFPVYAVSDDPVLLAGSCYETARSVRCAVDHQVYPGQAVQGMAAAFTCDAVTITLDAPQASAIMEVFARG